ncbi:unnamed protein product [Fusarium graminearum]|nr:unnamed protein product [Fusarium graminearum]
MRIRHKDIKPSNILIKNGRVILTDFGISKDFMDLTTSGTEGAAAAGTWMYMAPEIYEEQRRGRATDVWGLGCVLLELCTILTGEVTLEHFEQHRRAGRRGPLSGAYFTCSFRLFDWIWLLMGSQGEARVFIGKTLALAFLMLDPDPQRRITTRQLVDLLNDPRCEDFHDIGASACDNCRNTIGMSPQDIPLHSIFKKESNGHLVRPTKAGLTAETKHLWEEIKVRWLQNHIWWAEDLWV